MTNLLFVDDPASLTAMRTMLRPHRDRWTMTFVAGDRDAVQNLSHSQFDVVICDVHSRGASGGPFLDDVRELQPDAIRIALSTQLDLGAPIRSLSLAHHALAKPCDPQRLIGAIERSLFVRSRLLDPEFRALVGGLAALPSPSGTVLGLQAALSERPIDPTRVARIIADDVAISTKVLQVVNSAYFGLSRALTDPFEAVTYLGARTVGELVMSEELLRSFRGRSASFDAQIDALHQTSVSRAEIAGALAEAAGHRGAAVRDIWTGAFLADIGELLLLGAPEHVQAAVHRPGRVAEGGDAPDTSKQDASPLADSLNYPAVTGSMLGAHLISMWGLPHRLVESVAFGEGPPFMDGAESATFTWLARRLLEPEFDCGTLQRRHLASIGLVPDDLVAALRGVARAAS